MKSRIVVFGTGSVAKYFLDIVDLNKVTIVAFANSTKMDSFEGYRCIQPEELGDIEFDYILIGSGYVEQITGLLVSMGVSQEKIVSFIFDDSITYVRIKEEIDNVLDRQFKRNTVKKWLRSDIVLPDIYPTVFWNHEIGMERFYKDFVREELLRLISEKVKESNIEGEIAELGVYKGDFTILMDKCFPTQKLYLYDSFSGFNAVEVTNDSTISNISGEEAKFKDTSADLVLERLSHSQRVIIKEGYFPETFDENQEKFSFVSIDFNLEKPVYEALRLFYPLLSKGGYMLISDYFAPFYKGTKKAVDKWCSENNEVIVPIPDFYGSALIVKR